MICSFLSKNYFLTFVKFHNYVYNSYSDTRPVLSSLLTAFSFEPHIPSNWVNYWFWFISWLSEALPWVIFFKTDNWVAHFLSHCMSEKVLLSLLINVNLAEVRILGSQTLPLKPRKYFPIALFNTLLWKKSMMVSS